MRFDSRREELNYSFVGFTQVQGRALKSRLGDRCVQTAPRDEQDVCCFLADDVVVRRSSEEEEADGIAAHVWIFCSHHVE